VGPSGNASPQNTAQTGVPTTDAEQFNKAIDQANQKTASWTPSSPPPMSSGPSGYDNHHQPPAPKVQPGPSPHPIRHQCNAPLFWKGMAEYSVGAVDGAFWTILAVGAGVGTGGDPVAAGLVGALGAGLATPEIIGGSIDVAKSECV